MCELGGWQLATLFRLVEVIARILREVLFSDLVLRSVSSSSGEFALDEIIVKHLD